MSATIECPSWCTADPHLVEEDWVQHKRVMPVTDGLAVELTWFSDNKEPELFIRQSETQDMTPDDARRLIAVLKRAVDLADGGKS